MISSGWLNPMGSSPSMNPSLLRTNSAIMEFGGQAGSVASQPPFQTMVSQRAQFGNSANNMSLLGNIPNVSTLLNESFRGGGPQVCCSGLPSPQINILQRGVGGAMDMVPSGGKQDPLSFAASANPRIYTA